MAYAVNQESSTVTPIRTATNKALKPVHIPGWGGYTGVIAITPDGRTVYVLASNTLTPISVATGSVRAPIPSPAGIPRSPSGDSNPPAAGCGTGSVPQPAAGGGQKLAIRLPGLMGSKPVRTCRVGIACAVPHAVISAALR